jgi:hypothetical protein
MLTKLPKRRSVSHVVASIAFAAVGCHGSSSPSAPTADASADVIDAAPAIEAAADAPLAETAPPSADAASESSPEAAVEADGPPTQAFVRVADWAPDAPSGGFDFCLRVEGSSTWTGPLLGAAAVSFPNVGAYLGVQPGTYDLQLVDGGTTDCTTGVIPTTMGLSALTLGSHTTLALLGDVHATDNDASLKVFAFSDDSAVPSSDVAVRFLNAIPSVASVDMGEGNAASANFVPWFTFAQFGTLAQQLADGGSVDPNGYGRLSPVSGVELSAQQVGATSDLATATNVSLAAGTVYTIALVNGENGGPPPQFLVCKDAAEPVSGLTPCTLFTQ